MPVVGGLVGSGDRVGYTVHGDNVNLTARLEQLNKDYGTRIIVADSTMAEIPEGSFAFSELGEGFGAWVEPAGQNLHGERPVACPRWLYVLFRDWRLAGRNILPGCREPAARSADEKKSV